MAGVLLLVLFISIGNLPAVSSETLTCADFQAPNLIDTYRICMIFDSVVDKPSWWLNSTNICDWDPSHVHINCSVDEKLTMIDLSNLGLSKNLNTNISWPSTLEHIDLSDNSLTQTWEDFSTLPGNLTYLDLSSNLASGTIQWDTLPSSLEYISFDNNADIWADYSNATKFPASLIELVMFYTNAIPGPIDLNRTNMPENITFIQLFGTENINGTLELGFIPHSLEYLNLGANELTDVIDTVYDTMDTFSLNHLTLNYNQINSTMPDLKRFTGLNYLSMIGNGISDNLTDVFVNKLPDSVEYLYLHENRLHGTVSFEKMYNYGFDGLNVLRLGNNQLKGTIDWFWLKFFNVWSLYLDNNMLSGTIQWNFGLFNGATSRSIVQIQNNSFVGSIDLNRFDNNVVQFFADDNYFNGTLNLTALPPMSGGFSVLNNDITGACVT